jgi:hypothetical protein
MRPVSDRSGRREFIEGDEWSEIDQVDSVLFRGHGSALMRQCKISVDARRRKLEAATRASKSVRRIQRTGRGAGGGGQAPV